MMGREQGTCDAFCVLYVTDESLNSASETNMTLYVNWNVNKNLKHKQSKTLSVSVKNSYCYKKLTSTF